LPIRNHYEGNEDFSGFEGDRETSAGPGSAVTRAQNLASAILFADLAEAMELCIWHILTKITA